MTWTTISGTLARISAGSRTNVWAVNAARQTSFVTRVDDSNPWIKIYWRPHRHWRCSRWHGLGCQWAATALSSATSGDLPTGSKSPEVSRESPSGRAPTSGPSTPPGVSSATQETTATRSCRSLGTMSDIGAEARMDTVWAVNSAGYHLPLYRRPRRRQPLDHDPGCPQCNHCWGRDKTCGESLPPEPSSLTLGTM